MDVLDRWLRDNPPARVEPATAQVKPTGESRRGQVSAILLDASNVAAGRHGSVRVFPPLGNLEAVWAIPMVSIS